MRFSRLTGRFLLTLFLMLTVTACSLNPFAQKAAPRSMPSVQFSTMLPGQQIWKDNTSSFLFGTNDTYEWSKKNLQNQPALQKALRDAGFTLIRSFFPDNAKDADIEARIRTIENSGSHCLGVITNVSNTTFNEHLVRYLGKRCSMYEFGNEPDNKATAVPLDTYLSQWNKQIPKLRQINPQAIFIGPVSFTYDFSGHNDFIRSFLESTKSSNVLPDAVSFHLYPCFQESREDCLGKAGQYKEAVEGIRGLVKDILGKELPVGVTEWNYDPNNPPPSYGDEKDFMTQFSVDALDAIRRGGAAFACQFDAASYSGYGRLDMLDVNTNQPKAQYDAIKSVIAQYRSDATTKNPNTSGTGKGLPLVSRDKTVKCSKNTDGTGNASALVDGHYGNWGFWGISVSNLPDSCAIQIDKGPSRLMLVWESAYNFDYISNLGLSPQAYTISTSADSTDGNDGTWKTVVTVTDNLAHVREHVFDFAGQSWVKMTVTKGQDKATQPYIRLDEIDLFDVSATLDQTFVFSGDSITGMAYSRFDLNQPSFPELVHRNYSQYFPPMVNAGMGGWNSENAAKQMDFWLSLNPDMRYWLVGWGTNDALESVPAEQYRIHMQTIIDKIKQAGHIPILAHVPYIKKDNAIDQLVQAYNKVIDELTASNKLIPGPNLYEVTHDGASTYLDKKDGIHPTDAGGVALTKAWFDAIRAKVF